MKFHQLVSFSFPLFIMDLGRRKSEKRSRVINHRIPREWSLATVISDILWCLRCAVIL